MTSAIEYRRYGPPGTGKTTWLAKRATISAAKYGADQVSICSLTNAAVREIAGRDLTLDPENVTTLHARCKRALNAKAPAEVHVKSFVREYGATDRDFPKTLFRLDEDDDQDTDDIAEVMLSQSREPTNYELANIYRQQLIPPSGDQWGHETYAWWQTWKEWMDENGYLDFTGWLEAALEIRPLPAQQVVFVDEAQDHTPLQLAVIRSWSTRYRILVGDDDQNLYEWSGAVPQAFFTPELPEEQEEVLSQSYRVPRAVHSVATKWAEGIRNRRHKDYLPRDHEGSVKYSRMTLMDIDAGQLPGSLLSDPDKTYMFLTSCGYMLDPIVAELRQRGIPFHNPYRRSNARWNPLASVMPRLDAFMQSGLWSGVALHSWASQLRTKGVFQTSRKEALERWFGEEDEIDLDDLKSTFVPSVYDRIMRRDISIFGLRRVGATGSWEYALRVYQRPEADREPKVIVGTIHSVKGGEADMVYLFPDLSRAGFLDWQSYSNADRVRRLYYVGMTRAKEDLVLCSASGLSVGW